jgi:glutathionyl-hydroquinone reductase
MGQLLSGKWTIENIVPETKDGEFKRQTQKFRDVILPHTIYEPESRRYHLYVSLACPWAHRTLIMRKLKNLEEHVAVSVVSPKMMDDGWSFEKEFPGTTGDKLLNKKFLYETYTSADPSFSGKVTVPVLYDSKAQKIVNNESSEIIRIFNEAFNKLTKNQDDFYPKELRSEIDEVNNDVYEHINNGVYRTGFAQNQSVYEESFDKLFSALDRIEKRLEEKRYLVGEQLTEADIRLYTTLVRFDPVYYVHFKCNRTLIRDFPNLSVYLKRLYEEKAFKETTNFEHIKTHYYFSHRQFNPYGIIARGPVPLV